jgi:hypothetical protein
VDVEGVRHRVVGIHFVDQADLHAIADAEPPVDLRVLRPRLAVDELPAHVRRRRHAVHLDHVVFPLDPLGRFMAVRVLAVAVVVGVLM